MTPAVDAASLLLMREGGDGPELLVIKRAARLAFGGGAFAFPGGRVDPGDHHAAAALDPPVVDGALRIAALRETVEETGIDLSAGPNAIANLVLFARWCPPEGDVPRRFDTRFYLAAADPAVADPRADGGETAHAFWARPADILDRCRTGQGRALFPTRRLLERLARLTSYGDARDEALRLPTGTIHTRRETRADGDWLCIPEGRGYPVTEERLADVARY